jgi:hypothetical protein
MQWSYFWGSRKPAVVDGPADRDLPIVEVDLAPRQTERLTDANTRPGDERDRVVVASRRSGDEVRSLLGREHDLRPVGDLRALARDERADQRLSGVVVEPAGVLVDLGERRQRLVTIGYHARSAEALAGRYGCRIFGPPKVASRLGDPSLLEVLEPDADGPAGVRAFAIGRPVRGERPLWLPSHRAIAFGDAVVTTPEGDLRVWAQERPDERRVRWYHERFNPKLEPLVALKPQRILTTHGAPVLAGGSAALRGALAAEPWYGRGE